MDPGLVVDDVKYSFSSPLSQINVISPILIIDVPILIIGSHYMLSWTAASKDGVTRKRRKMKIIKENYLERTHGRKVSINSRLKAI